MSRHQRSLFDTGVFVLRALPVPRRCHLDRGARQPDLRTVPLAV
jgi:hypothetical protein